MPSIASKYCAPLTTGKNNFFSIFPFFTEFSFNTDFRIVAVTALVRKTTHLPKFQEEHLCLELTFKSKGYPCQ